MPTLVAFMHFQSIGPLGRCLSISLHVRLCVCPSVCLFVCPFTFEVLFNGIFAPTSWSRMSNIFRDSESLGKSNEKKWSNIWTFLFGSGLKWPHKKSFFSADFALQNMVKITLPDGFETSGQRAYCKFWHISRCFWVFAFWIIFPFFKRIGVLGILGPPGNHASRWIRDFWSKGILQILAYFSTFLSFCLLDDFFNFQKIVFLGILDPPYCGIGPTIRIGRENLCLLYAGFFKAH